jgi:tetrapyrrole methylase family protein/MazG family protein
MTESQKYQPDIIILGLGPGDPELLTLKASRIINKAREIYLRTREHPTVEALPDGLVINSFDDIYREEESFDEVYLRISEKIINLAKKTPGLIYAVPGDPYIAEATPALIVEKAKESGLNVEIIPGVSFLEPTFAAIGGDPLPQVSILDALDLSSAHHPSFPPDKPALVVQIYSKEIASDVKLTLMAVFPDQHPIILVHDAGNDGEIVEHLPLYQLDRSPHIKNRSALYIPPLEEGTSLESFQEIIAHLRAPEGCPWDREQDHQTLRPNLLEESYETLEAIDANDPAAMQEEFGDLLLQIILHSQIASELGEFNMSDVIQGIYQKIIKRHPHVFDDLELEQAEAVIQNWERIKVIERENNGERDKGLLDGVPGSLPALTQAVTYQKRAARVGFDWQTLKGVLEKLPEEIEEIKQAEELNEKSSELGDILFTLVNIARWMKIDAESALRGANQRFKKRFTAIEKKARAGGRELSDLSLEELEQLWEDSKANLGD